MMVHNETLNIIDKYRETLLIPITHVWHKDNGFRKTVILNKAIAKTSCEYIIQIDGDVIMHPSFIYDYIIILIKKVSLLEVEYCSRKGKLI